MAISSREQLKDYCLRRLGEPVVQVNVDDTQLEDRIDDALQYFGENLYDGIEKVFLKHEITQNDIDNKNIPAADPIVGVIRIFPARGIFSGSFFNEEFQLRIRALTTFTGISSIDYSIQQMNFSLLENILQTEKSFRFNKKKNVIEMDVLWGTDVKVGDTLIIEAYRVLDPTQYTEIFDDIFLKQYATALIKRQWGENLKKFEGAVLPGGLSLNGQTIWQEAVEEIQRLEEEVLTKWSEPPLDLIG